MAHGPYSDIIGASFYNSLLWRRCGPVYYSIFIFLSLSLSLYLFHRYFRGAKAAVIVFDVTKQKHFDSIEAFRRDILQYADPAVVVAVAGNKVIEIVF